MILVYLYHHRYSQTPEGKRRIDELKLKIPSSAIFTTVSSCTASPRTWAFFSPTGWTLSNRLKSKKIVGNVVIEEKIEEAAKKIREGASVSNSLAKSGFLPKMVLGMISAGEASDNLDTMLVNIGTVYETELDLTVTGLTSLIEPLIIIFMGLVIALIVMSVILPITQMNLMLQ